VRCTLLATALAVGVLTFTAPVAAHEAVSTRQADRLVTVAKRDLRRAELRLQRAREVRQLTAHFSATFGPDVGRWVWLAREVGWPRECLPTLMAVIARESGGDPRAANPTSSAAGLLQFLSLWWAGRWNPFEPRAALRHGYLAWRAAGWQPWALSAY